jgi:colanic acid biosynthesis glycosyl transferase WcaI
VKVRRADVIFVPSPLLTLGALGRMLRHPLRAKLVYNVQELYPDLGVELGMIRNPLVIAALRWLERYVYRGAAAITAITDGIRDAVIRKQIPPSRVLTIPNFVDTSDLRPGSKDNAFSRTHGWADRFVVLYAGNIGHAQRLDGLLEAARLLESDPRVLVAFVGEGNDKTRLMSAAAEMGLRNVQFLEHQPYALVPDIYAASDVCVVALSEGILVGALPSKVFRIMACQRPVLALCDPRSDLATLVRTAGSGCVCQPRDGRAIAESVHGLATAPTRAEEMARRGREFVLERVARSFVTSRYFQLFSELAA